ncbi:MAG: hypothetical protein SGPRY_008107 [Prymnesium sp.]
MRVAFDLFIASFPSYMPVLMAIKYAYDEALEYEKTRAQGLNDVESRLSRMQGETQQASLASSQIVSSLELEAITLRNKMRRTERYSDELESRLNATHQQANGQGECGGREYWQGEAVDFRRKAEIEFNEATRLRSQLTELEYREEVVLKVPNEQHAPIAEALSEANQTIELMQQDATEKASTSTIQQGELTAGYPDGFDWAHESLEGVPLLDPAWKGKRPDQIIPILVEDLSTLHERYLLDVWAAASEGVDKVICSLLAAGVNLPERVLVALKAGQPTQPPRDRVGEWATMQGREDKLRPAGVSVVALGETGEAREVDGTSYGGLVVIRDDVWGLQETRNVIRSVWRASGKQGERGRGLRALLRGELVEKHGSTHPGLICADAINFEAACWRHQAVEPQVGQHT